MIAAPLFLSSNATAQSSSAAKTAGCENAKTQMEMNECLAAAYERADKELNATYQAMKAKLSSEDAAKLEAAERAWLKYRDANCEAESALYEGGSIRPSITSACLERATRMRIAELHTVYDTGNR